MFSILGLDCRDFKLFESSYDSTITGYLKGSYGSRTNEEVVFETYK